MPEMSQRNAIGFSMVVGGLVFMFAYRLVDPAPAAVVATFAYAGALLTIRLSPFWGGIEFDEA